MDRVGVDIKNCGTTGNIGQRKLAAVDRAGHTVRQVGADRIELIA